MKMRLPYSGVVSLTALLVTTTTTTTTTTTAFQSTVPFQQSTTRRIAFSSATSRTVVESVSNHHNPADEEDSNPTTLQSSLDATTSSNCNTRSSTRRHFGHSLLLTTAAATVGGWARFDQQAAAWAASDSDTDLTSQLFNTDGSLKEGVSSEAAFRTVEFTWPQPTTTTTASNERFLHVDGVTVQTPSSSTSSTDSVRLSYQLPGKWKGGFDADRYVDLTQKPEGLQACRRISIYQSPLSSVSTTRLEKAASVGIAPALDMPDDLFAVIQRADLISGRKRVVSSSTNNENEQRQTFWEFDMAVAPSTCDATAQENLGLGFCPFNEIYLLSGTLVDETLYVMVIVCDKDQWKLANADLRKVRSTFTAARA